ISDSGASEALPVTGFAATREGLVTVVRPLVVDEQPRMLVRRYTSKGRESSWSSEHFWRTALVRNDQIRGVVEGPTTWEERVTLEE
ncbi:MAG TPA: hypothetical protein VM733_17095, partial [Thermoanaerobaculia bacterium]|nr:hypothetical protein [Thermoanaerobaculia bacterium]